jgi:hypothetical protein
MSHDENLQTHNKLRRMFERDFELYGTLQKEMVLVTKMSDQLAVVKEFDAVIALSWTVAEREALRSQS